MAKPIESAQMPELIRGCATASEGFAYVEAAADGETKLKKFSGVAYTGVPMMVGYGDPVTIDLQGLQPAAEQIAALKDHDPSQVVGHQSVEITSRQIKTSGVISGVREAAAEVSALSANGFPWQMSVGVQPSKMDRLQAGESEVVNGRTVKGPGYIVRSGVLREISFVAMGADYRTSGQVAASLKGDRAMEFGKWLEAAGWEADKLTEAQRAKLQAAYDAEIGAKPVTPEAKPIEASADAVAALRASAAAEMERIATINRVAANHADIAAKAVKEGWDATKTELEVLRASRPVAPAIHVSATGQPIGGEVLHAAFATTLRLPNIEKDHKPEALEAAHRTFSGRMGIQQLLLTCAAQNGMHVSPGTRLTDGNLRECLRYAFTPSLQAGFSTLSVSSILEAVANKSLLAGYMEIDQTWREIAQVVSVVDFKDHKAYRLLDDMEYEELSPTGEIRHGKVSDETITRSADTYAKMFALTRKSIINDDLGAFDDLRNRIGRGAAKKFNNVFWTAFINNSSFFTTALTNYVEGATTNLGTDGVGLGLGVKAFRKMTSPSADGTKRIGNDLTPAILLVPPELEANAENLYKNMNLGSVKVGDANIYANKYRPVVQNRLSQSTFTGYSTTAWYLFADPRNAAPMWAAFLNGNETPTVESAEADFNTLGIQLRGYHDFGAGQNEYLSGIKSKGAA